MMKQQMLTIQQHQRVTANRQVMVMPQYQIVMGWQTAMLSQIIWTRYHVEHSSVLENWTLTVNHLKKDNDCRK